MSDEFLYRLRVTPPPALAAQLKLRLDAQAALQARRRTFRRLSVFAGLFLAGTAFALVSPSLRNYALEVFRIETRQDKPEIAQAEAEKSSRAPVSPFAGNAGARAGGAAPAYQSTPDSQPASTTAFNPFARTDRPAATESRPPAPVQDTPSEQTAPIAWRAGPPMTLEGSRTLVPLSDAVVARYQQRVSTPARIVSKHSDASSAFGRFCRREVDLVHTIRAIEKVERATCTSLGTEYLELPVAYEAITVVANPTNTWATALSRDDLKKIDRGGLWSAINAQWPNRRWRLYTMKRDSEIDYSSDALAPGWSRSAGYTTSDLASLVSRVRGDPDGIAYLPFVDLEPNASRIRAIGVINSKGVVELPTRATIDDATYEPLSRPIFLYVNAAAADRPEVAEFVEFYLSDAADAIATAKFLPLAQGAYKKALRNFKDRKIGTVFSETPALGVPVDALLEREAKRYSL